MDIFSVFTLLGGLALFLYGMNVLSEGLEKISGGRLERMLEKLTNNPIKGVLLGAAVTAVIQSSSATTVMVVGFVNSGIMKLSQAIGIIMGANIGTTVTAWILSLSGLEGESVWVQMLKPDTFSPILAVIGIVLIMFCKSGRKRDVGSILVGFAILMFGMSTMSNAVEPLADVPEFAEILTLFTNPLFGVLAGAILTGIIQSSSASVGILQALSQTGQITFGAAIPIILGQNIGTCVTALISCIGAKRNAKRAAMVHLYFNIIGTIVFLSLFYIGNAIFHFTFLDTAVTETSIAIVHTTFNVVTTLLLLPFSKQLGKLAELTIREKSGKEDSLGLDDRFLNSPSFAIEQCRGAAGRMAELSRDTLLTAIHEVGHYDRKRAETITQNENMVDAYEDKLGTYLVKISSRPLSEEDSKETSRLLHCIGDFERISDHAVNILDAAREMHEKNIQFSQEAKEELGVMSAAVEEILQLTIQAFQQNDLTLARQVEPLEQVIDELKAELRLRHITRLKDGKCTIELGFVFSDLLTNYERVSDHCSNIAVCLIEISNAAFDTHGYLNRLKSSGEPEFTSDFERYHEKYVLPGASS